MALFPPNGPFIRDAANSADHLVATDVAAGASRDELQSALKYPDLGISVGSRPDRAVSPPQDTPCATLSESALIWEVDRATAQAVILGAGIPAFDRCESGWAIQ